ncbi:MAG TPA: hypothetical protein VFZ16_05660 [Hyphomicrobiaceae bacterium]|nr:hypothetical protein [Hyphomicrobiaceae bacterium]
MLRLAAGAKCRSCPVVIGVKICPPFALYLRASPAGALPALGSSGLRALQHAFTSGFIERNSFETVSGGSIVYEYDHFTEAERKGKLVKDLHPDEHATCYIVQGRGLVVISSCGHVGLINTIKQAMSVSGVSKLHAALGGVSPHHRSAGVHRAHGHGAGGARARHRHPDALLRCRLYRQHAPAHARRAGNNQRRLAFHVCCLTDRARNRPQLWTGWPARCHRKVRRQQLRRRRAR